LQRLADNPKIAANLIQPFSIALYIADAEFFINLNINEQPAKTFVIDIDGEFAGTIGLTFRDDVFTRSPLFGYWLGEPYWGRGIMTKPPGWLRNTPFQTFDIICLQAGVFSYNPASMRVLEKAGYVPNRHFKRNGL
jgi:ribosomal-protein-alanine N-acetyltransferase